MRSLANTSNAASATATPRGVAWNTSYEPYSPLMATARRKPASARLRVTSLTNGVDRVVAVSAARARHTRSRTPEAGCLPFAGGLASVASATTCVMLAPEPGKPRATAMSTGAHSSVYSSSSDAPLAADADNRSHASHVPQTRRATAVVFVVVLSALSAAFVFRSGAKGHDAGVSSPKCANMPARLHPTASRANASSASVLFFCVSRASRLNFPT